MQGLCCALEVLNTVSSHHYFFCGHTKQKYWDSRKRNCTKSKCSE